MDKINGFVDHLIDSCDYSTALLLLKTINEEIDSPYYKCMEILCRWAINSQIGSIDELRVHKYIKKYKNGKEASFISSVFYAIKTQKRSNITKTIEKCEHLEPTMKSLLLVIKFNLANE